MDLGIGVRFEPVTDRASAQVRIGFEEGDGHWSYVGRQVLKQGVDDRTMNLDPTDRISSGDYGVDVAIHEIGHTLGFPHEHQNPNAGIVWDEEAVYRALGGPPNNWSREMTFHNIIRKIQPDQVQGSSWDPDSVMHYPFEPGLILKPEQYRQGLQPAGGLSQRDREWVHTFYPPLTPADDEEIALLEAKRLQITPGAAADLRAEADRRPLLRDPDVRDLRHGDRALRAVVERQGLRSSPATTTAARTGTPTSGGGCTAAARTCCASVSTTRPTRARRP